MGSSLGWLLAWTIPGTEPPGTTQGTSSQAHPPWPVSFAAHRHSHVMLGSPGAAANIILPPLLPPLKHTLWVLPWVCVSQQPARSPPRTSYRRFAAGIRSSATSGDISHTAAQQSEGPPARPRAWGMSAGLFVHRPLPHSCSSKWVCEWVDGAGQAGRGLPSSMAPDWGSSACTVILGLLQGRDGLVEWDGSRKIGCRHLAVLWQSHRMACFIHRTTASGKCHSLQAPSQKRDHQGSGWPPDGCSSHHRLFPHAGTCCEGPEELSPNFGVRRYKLVHVCVCVFVYMRANEIWAKTLDFCF